MSHKATLPALNVVFCCGAQSEMLHQFGLWSHVLLYGQVLEVHPARSHFRFRGRRQRLIKHRAADRREDTRLVNLGRRLDFFDVPHIAVRYPVLYSGTGVWSLSLTMGTCLCGAVSNGKDKPRSSIVPQIVVSLVRARVALPKLSSS